MKQFAWLAAALLGACATNPALPGGAPLSHEALMQHVRVLSSDEYEGRSPGTRGEELSIAYIARAFAAIGLEPGANGSYMQAVPMATSAVTNNPALRIGENEYAYGVDFVAWTKRQNEPRMSLDDAELVFVGYGVVAPENNWNDYAGVDLHGRIAVILVNDPDFASGEDLGFGGRRMTYYGRWTYKFEEAARQGAAGALIIHETEAAAYPWPVVRSSWTGPQHDLVREDGGASRVGVEGWITSDVARTLFRNAGLDFDRERGRAQNRDFRAVSLRQRASVTLETSITRHMSHNVVGVLPGRTHPEQAVLYGAHWDHLGHCTPVDGDDICNGARDNATGIAGLIELGRQFREEGAPQRSVAFIAFTAEESGLLGSQYYAEHPTFAPRDLAAMINMDGLSTAGPSHDMIVVGYGQNSLQDTLTTVLQGQNRRVAQETYPERGSFYRSDHFNLAKIGVPVLYAGAGNDLVVGGTERARQLSDSYLANAYHKPADEIGDDWDMSGATQDLQALYAVGRRVADGDEWPQWSATSEFRAARAAQGR